MPDDTPPAPEAAPTAATGPPPPAPTTAGPTDEASVDGRTVTLVWHPLLGGRKHRVQVAADEGFDDVLFETTVGSENSVRVTWPETPEAGRRFWRVQCFRHGTWGPWSAPATFRFTGKEVPPPPPEPSSEERHVPHRTGTTSERQALTAVLVFVVGVVFVVELALLAPVGSLIDPDEAGGASAGGSGSAPPAFEATPASLSEMVGTASAVNAGEQTFSQYCASCHGQQGGGSVGPNLTDKYWIHGGQNMDIYQIIHDGASNAGMPAWEGTISDREMAQLVAFVRSLEGTDPSGAKGPEGDPVERSGASGDTTTTAARR